MGNGIRGTRLSPRPCRGFTCFAHVSFAAELRARFKYADGETFGFNGDDAWVALKGHTSNKYFTPSQVTPS